MGVLYALVIGSIGRLQDAFLHEGCSVVTCHAPDMVHASIEVQASASDPIDDADLSQAVWIKRPAPPCMAQVTSLQAQAVNQDIHTTDLKKRLAGSGEFPLQAHFGPCYPLCVILIACSMCTPNATMSAFRYVIWQLRVNDISCRGNSPVFYHMYAECILRLHPSCYTKCITLDHDFVYTETDKDTLAAAAQQLQHSNDQQSLSLHKLEQEKQAALQEREALRQKNGQQKAELAENANSIRQLQEAAANLADDLQSARSVAGRQVGQHTALRELSAEHAACTAELATKTAALHSLNASMVHLQSELAASTAQQAQHEQDSTRQQTEFVGQMLQELQVLEAALTKKGQDCDSCLQQYTTLKAESDARFQAYSVEHEAQAATVQQLQQELHAQRAQRVELTEKLLALEAQVAYKQHKLDALHKEATKTAFSRDTLQADLHQLQQHVAALRQQPQTADVSTSTLSEDSAVYSEPLTSCVSSSRQTQTSLIDTSCANNSLEDLQEELALSVQHHAEYRRLQEQLLLEAEVKVQAESESSRSKQEQLEAAVSDAQASRTCMDTLETKVASLQSEMQATAAHSQSLQQSLQQVTAELEPHIPARQKLIAAEQALHDFQHAAADLQQQLAHAKEKMAAAQAQQQEALQQAAAASAAREELLVATAEDKGMLHELQLQLNAVREDRVTVQKSDASARTELQQTQQALQNLQSTLADQSKSMLSLQAASDAANAEHSQLLNQLAQARQAVELAENELVTGQRHQLATQEQLQQDRDSLMEEVLSAKARAADQERTIQSLRVAADATAREKALLINQLDATEQQLAIQAQELLCQQRETQRLQAGQRDQAAFLKKAQLKGSSNEHGLRGLQQRLQEALQDKKTAELEEQGMHHRLQEAEQAVDQAREHNILLVEQFQRHHRKEEHGKIVKEAWRTRQLQTFRLL